MKNIEIKNRYTGKIIISGKYESVRDAIEKNLRGANLRGANLRGADLGGADLGGADLGGADLIDANLIDANLRGANLRGANLRGANLRGADLGGADLGGADLIGANLIDANLRGANLRGANLRGADLGGANLIDANLIDAKNFGDIKKQILYIFHQHPIEGRYIFYKKVIKIKKGEYSSCYDEKFKYYDGKIARAKDADEDKSVSCGRGIHVSHPFYWQGGDCLIAIEVPVKIKKDGKMIDNIITCLDGKLRARQIKVIGEIKILN